jgi:hypothetical protein
MNLHEAFKRASHIEDAKLVARAVEISQQVVLPKMDTMPLLFTEMAVAFEAGRIFETAAKEKK